MTIGDYGNLAKHAQERYAHHLQEATMALFWAHYDRVHGDIDAWECEMWAVRHHIEEMQKWSARLSRISKSGLPICIDYLKN